MKNKRIVITGRILRKRWILVIFMALLTVGLLYLEPTFQLVKAQQESGSFSDDFSKDSGSWQYLGSAYRDPTNQCVVLTASDYFQGGVAFFNNPIQGSFTANFRYKAGGGSYQGDGFTMFFYKQKYSTIDSGCSLGFSSKEGSTEKIVPGYGIEFDGWQNIPWDFEKIIGGQQNPQGDPSANHIALVKDFAGNHLTYVNDQRIADNNWHQVSVKVQASTVKVYLDQGLVLQWNGTLNRTYDGFGFSGGTGGPGSNWHIIDDFSITSQNLQVPSLTTSCITSVSQSSFNVKINGYLTFNGSAISGAPILLSYSVTGGDSWQDLTLVHTSSNGSYSALWLLSVTGDYMLKAVYKGNENYLGTSNIINFAMEPCTEQSVFSVTSNSTLSELSFSSSSKELSFSVSGDPGTMGYVNVYIPKSLVNDISSLKVYLDNNQIEYTAQPQSDGWLLYATYHHSTHSVMISLGSSSVNPSTSPTELPTGTTPSTSPTQTLWLDWVKIAILAFMGVLGATVAVVAIIFLSKKTEKSSGAASRTFLSD